MNVISIGELGDDKTCSICLKDMNQCQDGHSRVIVKTTCGHCFHQHCLERWLENKTTCPHCRSQLRERRQDELNEEDLDTREIGSLFAEEWGEEYEVDYEEWDEEEEADFDPFEDILNQEELTWDQLLPQFETMRGIVQDRSTRIGGTDEMELHLAWIYVMTYFRKYYLEETHKQSDLGELRNKFVNQIQETNKHLTPQQKTVFKNQYLDEIQDTLGFSEEQKLRCL